MTTDFGMGMSWNWKTFNQRTNSYAPVLGSNMNARIDWGFYLRYVATLPTSLYAGIDYTHRSNGGMRQPDQGINVIGPSVGLRYNLAPERTAQPIDDAPPFRPSWGFVVGVAGGRKNVLDERNDLHHDFGAADFTTGVQRQFYRYGKIAAGPISCTTDRATRAAMRSMPVSSGRRHSATAWPSASTAATSRSSDASARSCRRRSPDHRPQSRRTRIRSGLQLRAAVTQPRVTIAR